MVLGPEMIRYADGMESETSETPLTGVSDGPRGRGALAGVGPAASGRHRVAAAAGLLLLVAVAAAVATAAVRPLAAPRWAVAARGGAGSAAAEDAIGLVGVSHLVSPFETIKESFKPDALTVKGAFTGGECHVNTTERCPVSAMPKDKLTAVFPGGKTRCLLSTSPSYFFMVIPGDSDKLIIYFQGGGACWDGATTTAGLCIKAVAYEGEVGIFDKNNPKNPYRNYTIVIPGYCSGDAHTGNRTQDRWTVLKGGPAVQNGYINARTAIDWTKKNFLAGGKALESLIVTGSSAGALGTQLWSRTVLQEFKYKNAAVIADSYAAVFPPGVQGGMIRGFGACDVGLIQGAQANLCRMGTIDVQSIYENTMSSFPDVAFANLDSKVDLVQVAFFKAVYFSKMMMPDHLSLQQFSQHIGSIYRRYNMKPNWVSYMVNAGAHMYLNNDVMYQTTPVGNQIRSMNGAASTLLKLMGNHLQGRDTPLVEWLSGFPVKKYATVHSECVGLEPPKPTLPPPPKLGFFGFMSSGLSRAKSHLGVLSATFTSKIGMDYCDDLQAKKTFQCPR